MTSRKSVVLPAASRKDEVLDKIDRQTLDKYKDYPTKRSTTQIAKPKKTRWLTRAMAEDFSRQEVLLSTFKEALLYLVFVIAVTMCTIGRRSPSMFYITQALRSQFLESEYETTDGTLINFEMIQDPTDFWEYLDHVMIDSFFAEYSSNPYDEEAMSANSTEHRILFENKVLGVPRIRQVRVKNGTCRIHKYFKDVFAHCYGKYSESTESRSSFGLKKGTAWTYSKESKTKNEPYTASLASYNGGGYYEDLSPTKNETLAKLEKLKKNVWITRNTRAIFIDFSLYNANLNLFCICKLIFEFGPSGGIIPSHSFQAVELLRWVDTWDYVTFGCECVVYVISAFFLIEEFREIIYFKFRYLTQFWTYIDLTIISVAAGNLLASQIFFPDPNEAIEKIRKNPLKYGNLEELGWKKNLCNNFAASLLFFTYIKLFKYINFNKTMGQLNNTLKRCALDILGFSIMFFIIFFAFAELGYLVFGTQVEDFRSFGVAMFTLLRTILGDFDYESIARANAILASVYFVAYIFFVFFVLLNMFLAIINDTYADVKTEIAVTPDEMQMTEYVKKGIQKIMTKFGCKRFISEQKKTDVNTTNQKIREALKKCGFSDLEIEMFFARYNIDPLAEVGEYDVKKILRELEGQSAVREKLDEDAQLVRVNDFVQQQEKLEQIERLIYVLSERVDSLIEKLGNYESARKHRDMQG